MDDKFSDRFAEAGERALEFSRSAFLRRTAVVGGAAALGTSILTPLLSTRAHAATCSCTTQDIVNIAATAELLATTTYFQALKLPTQLPQVNDKANRNYFQAALTEEYIHLEILQSLGGTPLATKFYYPEDMFSKTYTFLTTLEQLETAFIGAYLAAAQEFSGVVSSGITKANPTLIGAAVQIAGVECEHRALARVVLGANPPNNRYLETAPFTCVTQAATALGPFLTGGNGFVGPFLPPSKNEVGNRAEPYDFDFFPRETIA